MKLKMVQILRHRPYRIIYYALAILVLFLLFRNNGDHLNHLSFTKKLYMTRQTVWDQRAEQVKRAFAHAYHGYEKYAAPHDELSPLTYGFSDQ